MPSLNETYREAQKRLKAIIQAAAPRSEPPAKRAESQALEVPPKPSQRLSPYELLEGIHEALQTQMAEGEVRDFAFSVSGGVEEIKAYDPLKRRMTPWHLVDLYNAKGTAYVAVNYPSAGWHELRSYEKYTIDMTKSKKKVSYLYIKALPGQTASGRGIGKY